MRADVFPDARQQLLLTAALEDGEAARAAWLAWQAGGDFAAADRCSRRLQPLLYKNLLRQGVAPEMLIPLRDHYFSTLYRNKAHLRRLRLLLAWFAREDIPTLVLKGAALIFQVYGDPGLRPMADLDILVPHPHAARASALLVEAGWTALPLPARVRAEPQSVTAVEWHGADGGQLDLHFSPFAESLGWDAISVLWAASVPCDASGIGTRTLCGADQLLHLLAHGAEVRPAPAIRWVADAMGLLRSDIAIDWERFAAMAARLRLQLVASRLLAYLIAHHGADVPARVCRALNGPHPMLERLEYRARRGTLGPFAPLMTQWSRYVRLHPQRRRLALVRGFVPYLGALWGTQGTGETLVLALRKFLGRA